MKKMILKTKYPIQLEKLKQLFGESHIDQKIDRLEKIYTFCESKWDANLDRLSEIEIKYLIIAEAPPWTEGNIKYFYNIEENKEHIKHSVLLRSIWKAFFGNQHKERILDQLAQKGVLLVDTIPFAIKYTTTKRKKEGYADLVKLSKSYLKEQLNNPKIRWSDNVKVAFAFKLNGEAVINSFPEGIVLPSGQNIFINENMIAADKSGFPNADKFREIFGL